MNQSSESSDSLFDTQTPCSASVINSQDVEEPKIPWGKLYSTTIHLQPVDLHKSSFVMGRAETCDLTITKENFPNNILKIVSKNHLQIKRNINEGIVSITDLSKNGTYLNQTLVGREKTMILQDDDEIAIGTSKTRIYVYKVMENKENFYLPPELRRKYEISRLLGKGSFGEVRLLFEKSTFRQFAVKNIFKVPKKDKDKILHPKRIQTEIDILTTFSHPFIVSAKEVVETDLSVFIVMDYMEGGELTDYISSSARPLPEFTVKYIFYQMVLGVKYLHNQGITHRDLKPGNVLLNSTNLETATIKISDFGLSKVIDKTVLMETFCGTSYYMAPEIIDMKYTSYSQQVDIWSLGVILFYMLSQELPFKANSLENLFRTILFSNYVMRNDKWKVISDSAKNLVRKMLIKNPDQRIKIDEIISNEWISEDYEVQQRIQQLLNEDYIPNKIPRLNTNHLCELNDDSSNTS